MVNGATPACLIAVFHLVWRRQLFARSIPPRGDNTAGACGSLSRPASRRANTCTTTRGSGTIRRPARVFGVPTTILPSTSGAERRTYSRRARKSITYTQAHQFRPAKACVGEEGHNIALIPALASQPTHLGGGQVTMALPHRKPTR